MAEGSSLQLADAIGELRKELMIARSRATGADVQFSIKSATVELQVVATKEGQGNVGFRVPLVGLELGGTGSHSREATHRVVIEFGEPLDAKGNPIRVDRDTDIPLD